MDRDQTIQLLIEDQLDRLDRPAGAHWLLRALEYGFAGFANMSDAELAGELSRRGLSAEFECPLDPVDEPDDEDDEDDEELRVTLAGYARGGEEALAPVLD